MCTVTYIPSIAGNSFVLTSNRDEKDFRQTAPPAFYTYNGKKLVFPKDEMAGGSWIAINESGKLCCLLNGGFVAHQKQSFHTLSRGIVLLDFTVSELNAHAYFETRDLAQVEPFTIVAIDHCNGVVQHISEVIWDGKEKHIRPLAKDTPYIWSSVTLYTNEHRILRKEWFSRLIADAKDQLTTEKIFTFHTGEHTKDDSVNIRMQRDGGLKTVSITQVIPENGHLKMSYFDLLTHSLHEMVA